MAKDDKKKKAKSKDKAAKKGKPAKAAVKAPIKISPLAPASFPDLPVIAGVRYAAGEAGVRYANRTDVMLVQIAAGSVMAGVFTRSATRSAKTSAQLSRESSSGITRHGSWSPAR